VRASTVCSAAAAGATRLVVAHRQLALALRHLVRRAPRLEFSELDLLLGARTRVQVLLRAAGRPHGGGVERREAARSAAW